jgi:hypothetical protein
MAKKIHNALENFQLFKSFSKILAPETKNSILDLNVCFFGIDKFLNWIKGYHHGSLIKKPRKKKRNAEKEKFETIEKAQRKGYPP